MRSSDTEQHEVLPDETAWEFVGFLSPTTTPVPDEFFDVVAPRLKEAELRVALYIIRRTFGFKKDSDNISLRQMVDGIQTRDGRVLDQGTGLSKPAVIKAVRSLAQHKVIIATANQSQEKGFEATTYRLNLLRAPVQNYPLSTKFTRGGKPSLLGLVNEVDLQQTVLQETDHKSVVDASPATEKSSETEKATRDDSLSSVVDALTTFGVSGRVAEKLATAYPEEYVLEKLELTQWLVETRSPQVAKNPAGYLVKAVREDFIAPKSYRSKAEREAQERERQEMFTAEQRRRHQAEEEFQRAREERQQQLRAGHPSVAIPGTELTTDQAWAVVLSDLREQLSKPNYNVWVKETELVTCTDKKAVVAAPTRFQVEWLRNRLDGLIVKTLRTVLGFPVETEYVAINTLMASSGEGTPGSEG